MGNFQGDLLRGLNISWNDLETCAKALFDGKMAENMGKQFKTHPNMMNSWPAGPDLTQNGSLH